MAVYNTPSDAANTAVRAFLTSVGEHYLGRSFNTGSGRGKDIWKQIQASFNETCAYCGTASKLQIEHLIMFNRSEYGLHHPGNIVPVCKYCNERQKDGKKTTFLGKLNSPLNAMDLLPNYSNNVGKRSSITSNNTNTQH